MNNKRNFDLSRYLQTSKRKSYFVAAVTLALVVVVVLGGILPAYSAIAFQIEQNKKRNEAINTLNSVIDQFKNFLILEESDVWVIDKFNQLFPEKLDQSSVLNDFVSIADRRSLKLQSVSFSQIQREIPLKKQFKTRDVVAYQYASISVEGTRRGILDMIKDIENSKRIYNIVDVDISRNQKVNESGDLVGADFDATIRVEFYWTQKDFRGF